MNRSLRTAMLTMFVVGVGGGCGPKSPNEVPTPETNEPSSQAPDSGTPTSSTVKKKFLEDCNEASDCESGLCQTYAGKEKKLCTLACTSAAQCPAPSTGCNNQGVCKAP